MTACPSCGRPPAPEPVTISDVAAMTGLSRAAVYRALERGDIPGRKVGARWVLTRHLIERWLDGDDGSQGLRAVS